MSSEHSIKQSRSSKISFRDTSEVQEYETESAINQDEELKRGSRIIRRPDRKKSFTDIANRFRKKSSSKSNEEQQPYRMHPIPVQIHHRPSRIAVHHHRSQMDLRLNNSDRPPDSGMSSPVPMCSGSPVPMNSGTPGGINLSNVNRKSNPVRRLRSTDDLPPEIPEENIKTLLTLGFMSSLALDINESDSGEELTEAELDQLILAEEREERIKKMRVAPRPIKSEMNAAGKWSKIPILTKTIIRRNKPVVKTSSRMLAKYHDPLVHESRKVPITNRVTKWSLDGRLVHERPTMIRNNSEPNPKPWQVNMKKKLPELKPAPDNINTFGKESNFNKTDELGPWEAKSFTKSEEQMKGLPPTPAISQKFIFGKNSMLNPKKWFDNSNPEGNEKQKRPKTNEKKPPRWRL